MVDDGHTIAQLVGFFHVMGGQDNRDALLAKPADDVPQCQTCLRIETCAGLVEKQDLGIVRDGAGDLHSLGQAS